MGNACCGDAGGKTVEPVLPENQVQEVPADTGADEAAVKQIQESAAQEAAEEKKAEEAAAAAEKAPEEKPPEPVDSDGCFVIEFITPDGNKKVGITKKPLGLSFDSKMPLVIKKVAGNGADMGIQPGWTMKAIGGQECEGMPYKRAIDIIKTRAAKLAD